MNRDQFHQNLEETFKQCLEISKAKNQDYAGVDDPFRNFKNALSVGVSVDRGIMVRMMDKISRISNLLDKEAAVKDERLEDTLCDLINYSAILLAYLKNEPKN
jgi:hypothetical protein